jgi:hypothetical protein
MKSSRASLRTGTLNDFDLGFQAEMDNLIGLAYTNFERFVASADPKLIL